MAPHKALLIPDILHEIFKHLAPCPQLSLPDESMGTFKFPNDFNQTDPPHDTYKTRRLALARAARTCKAFANPASRVLWEILDGIEPVLLVLRAAQTSDGQVDAAGWARFEDVCKRVRALSFTARLSEAVGDMLSLIFNSHYHDGAGFKQKFQLPNLCALEVWWEVWADENPDPGIASLLLKTLGSLCVSPSLVLLCLPAITEDHLDVLETIAAACTSPRLLHLRVPDVRDLHTDADRILGPFISLQTATFGCIDREMLQVLGSLPKLRTLKGAFSTEPIDNHPADARRALFPALQELTTSDQDRDVHFPAMLSHLLSFGNSNSLTVLTLRIRTESPEGMLRYLNEAFSPSLSPALASLQELNMSIEIDPLPLFAVGAPIGWHSLDNRSFADVLPFLTRGLPAPQRISLVVKFPAPLQCSLATSFDVCDDDLGTVAATWPGLVSLKVLALHANGAGGPRGTGIGTGRKRPSLSALVALAERCRSLETVDVEFDSVGAAELARLVARAAACSIQPQTALRRIVVAIGCPPRSGSGYHSDGRDSEYHKRLRVTEPPRLAAALRTLFPNLRSGLRTEEQLEERMRMNAAERRRYWGCRWPWGPARDTEAEAETDALRLLKALNAYGVHPRRAATDTSLPVPRKTLLIVAVVGVLVAVTVLVVRLVLVQPSGPPGVPHAIE